MAHRAAVGNSGEAGYVAEVNYQPELPRLPELPEVKDQLCLKAYLKAAFKVTITSTQALKNFQKYTQQHGKESMRSYSNRVRVAAANYHTIKFKQAQREAADYPVGKGSYGGHPRRPSRQISRIPKGITAT